MSNDTNVNTIISILNRRDIILESLQPYLVINKDAVTRHVRFWATKPAIDLVISV